MAQMTKRKAYLALASGRVFEGWHFGALPPEAPQLPGERGCGEVVFNTSLSGYQEILTDPSYCGQIVAMTASHIGNYGINNEDVESARLYLAGFVVQELSAVSSNWRATDRLHTYLEKAGVPGLTGIDTRALTLHLRMQGAVNGIISLDGRNLKGLVKRAKKIPSLEGQDLAKKVTAEETYTWKQGSGDWTVAPASRFDNSELSTVRTHSGTKAGAQVSNLDSGLRTGTASTSRHNVDYGTGRRNDGKKVVVLDFGVKQNILRCLVDRHCEVTVVPATTSASQIMNLKPNGVVVSNGPGDPAMVSYGIQTLKELIDHKKLPIFGICLGHQLLGLALGGRTYKLKFGHHGANHPIKDLETGRVDITTQNHGFAVEGEKTSQGEWIVKGNPEAVVTHVNLNDNAVEGLRHKKLPVYSVQYHPEASAGPHDARHLFDRFMHLMEES